MKGPVCHELPHDFGSDPSAEVYFHYYSTDSSSIKNKVFLSKNLICLLLSGEKEVFNRYSQEKVDRERLLLVPAGSALMSENVADTETFQSILLFFPSSLMLGLLHDGLLGTKDHRPVQKSIRAIGKDAFIRNFEDSLQLLRDCIDKEEAMRQHKLQELLLYLLAKHPAQMHGFLRESLQADEALSFRQTVESNLDRGLCLEEMAFLCHMSLSTFKRKFAHVFNDSPGSFMLAHKMNAAKKLLMAGKAPADVSARLGYHETSSFSKAFKKHFKSSPKAFTAQLGL